MKKTFADEIDGILQEHILIRKMDGTISEEGTKDRITQARTAIIALIKSIVPEEPKFWVNMGKGLRNYNEGKRDWRKEMLNKLEENNA